MNKVLADILERPVPKGLTVTKVKSLIQDVAKLDEQPKLVYSSNGEKILGELNKYGAKDIPQNYRGVLLEHWLEILSQTQETITEVPRPTGPEATTLTSDQLENLGEQADEQKRKYNQTVKNQKEAVDKFKKAGEKRYQDQQKEKQTQELLNQFFKAKVVVVPTEEIPEVKLSKENKETLIAAETAAKEDPFTTKKIFEEKIKEALSKTEQEYKDTVSNESIEKTATHLVEQLRTLPDHKTVDDISDSPKALNMLSILNPLSDPDSEQMKKIIPDKEARKKFAREVQTLLLATEAERTVNLAGAKAIFGENIAYSLYGTDAITAFQTSSEEKDSEEGVEISPRDVYEKGKQISDFINKIKGFRNAEEVTSTGLAYYPTYGYSNAAVATRTASALTKALPAVGAVYGFKQGLILSQWARSGTPLLSAGNQNLVRLLTSQAGVQEIASASMVTFSNPIGFQLGKFSIGIATGANQATGTQIAIGGIRFGEKMAGAIAVKGGTQVAIVTGTQAGAQLAVGTSTILTKVLTFVGGLSSWATFGLSAIGGYLLGKIIEKGPQIKKWFSENAPVLISIASLGGLAFGGPGVGFATLGVGLAITGTLGSFAAGAFGVLGFIGRSIGVAIATPVIITLLVIPSLVAFIMLVINNSAYVVPPAPVAESGFDIGQDGFECTTEKTPTTITSSSTGSSAIAERAWGIMEDMYQGFWCYWNRSPGDFPTDTVEHPESYPELFDEKLYAITTNPTRQQVQSSGEVLFWCTWLIQKSYGENGNNIANTLWSPTMFNDFKNRKKMLEGNEMTFDNIKSGAVIFFDIKNSLDRVDHVGIVHTITPAGIKFLQSNAGTKDGFLPIINGVLQSPSYATIKGVGNP